MSQDPVPQSFFDLVAQMSHWLAGSWFTLVPVFLWGNRSLLYSIPTVVVLAAVKEFWYDEVYETPSERSSSPRDFAFYMVGIAVTLVIAAVK